MELTDDLIKSITDAISIGATLEMAAGYAGVTPVTLVEWLRRGKVEADRYDTLTADAPLDKAQGELFSRLFKEVEEAKSAARVGWLNVVNTAAQNDPQIALKLLEWRKANPDEAIDYAFPQPSGSVKSREAYQRMAETATAAPWWGPYLGLRAEQDEETGKPRWNWREAVYIAWASLPKRKRWPGTQEELARQVLGLTNDRTIREWKAKRPEIQERIVRLTGESLMRHRADVIDALAQVAAMPDPKAHSDRRLFLEMTGDYKPRQGVEHSGPEGEAITIEVIYDNDTDKIT